MLTARKANKIIWWVCAVGLTATLLEIAFRPPAPARKAWACVHFTDTGNGTVCDRMELK